MPLLARVYPNGQADVNHFHAAGGMGFVISSLLDAGLMHEDVRTVAGDGLRRYTAEPKLASDGAGLGRRATREPRHQRAALPPTTRSRPTAGSSA